ncbi:MAG: pyrroline-5-carboxylate reductase [Lachnospiraceae bacterium]|nr:pyrroline-5-carboxylate reductase [Lachnospiraceae bacterium]
MNRLGFIGMGNMAQAIAKGFIDKKVIAGDHVYAYAPHLDKLKANAERIGFLPVESVTSLVSQCDTIIMACKPYQIDGVLEDVRDLLVGKALVSIAAGWDYATYEPKLKEGTRVQFIMPNTPAMVGEGVMLFEDQNTLEKEEREELMTMFQSLGLVLELPSNLMGIGGAITGCGPAFIDLIIEALGDVGVKYGLKRAEAYAMASQMILGSAKLQLQTGEHPGVLKDNVCSPGGTTIRGVDALEHAGIRAAMIDAVDAIMR